MEYREDFKSLVKISFGVDLNITREIDDELECIFIKDQNKYRNKTKEQKCELIIDYFTKSRDYMFKILKGNKLKIFYISV